MEAKQWIRKEKKISLLNRLKTKFYFLFRLNRTPVVKIYNGYGNDNKIIIFGHVFKVSPLPRKTYRSNWITNMFAVLRLFMVKVFPDTTVSLEWQSKIYQTHTEKDGFFIFEISLENIVAPGWYNVMVRLTDPKYLIRNIQGNGSFYIPFESQHGFISDIDDTFLVSYSAKIRRRLYVLFTKNARTRKPFEGVIYHYQSLAAFGQVGKNSNPFFYVSSSEWNLYNFIVDFARFNDLPKGVFLLGQIKKLKDFWRSGQNNHSTKFMRIVRIVEAYPDLKFVLLGDDSQQDPIIYSSIVKHFPEKIIAVYIRRVRKTNYEKVKKIIDEMQIHGVACCYFEHSAEAMIHSKSIGLAK
jgi:phosphatidate phosphatase APP1